MDSFTPSPPSRRPPRKKSWRPRGCDNIALVLQGGGALGAYQAGVYQALHEAGLEPDWVAGVSIGGINAAIIAGNPPERRVERLRKFWETHHRPPVSLFAPDGDDRRARPPTLVALLTTMLGQPGFFRPNPVNPWFSPRGSKTATSLLRHHPAARDAARLVDFDLLNSGGVRYAAGAVNVPNGNFAYFDSTRTAIMPEHVMASGALPPALSDDADRHATITGTAAWSPTRRCSTCWTMRRAIDMLVFQVDLFSARGALPRDMDDVLARQKDIQFSSRTRLVTDHFRAEARHAIC